MPISTTPLPTGMMSPPSKVACPQSCSGSPHHTVRADEVRVELVDRLHQQRLVVPGRPVERVEGQRRRTASRWCRGCRACSAAAASGTRGRPVRLPGQRDVAGAEVVGQVGGRPARRSGTRRAARGVERLQERAGVVDQPEADLVRRRSCGRAARPSPRGSPCVSASRSCSSTTSTPRSRSLLTKSAWSRWAFSTHMTSSNSRSSPLVGVSRRCASPGAQTRTLRSLPDLGVDAVRPSWDRVLTRHLLPHPCPRTCVRRTRYSPGPAARGFTFPGDGPGHAGHPHPVGVVHGQGAADTHAP